MICGPRLPGSEELAPFFGSRHSRPMLTIISGTNRPASNTGKIVRQVESVYRNLRVKTETLDLAKLPREIFDASSYQEKPGSFAPFAQGVLDASGLVVVTPEYNGSFPGVLKYFIDMLKFPESFERRPVCFVGLAAGMWGAMRSVEQLQQIFGYRNAHLFPERVFIPKVFEVLDDSGEFKDPELLGRLKTQASGFIEFVENVKSVRLRSAE